MPLISLAVASGTPNTDAAPWRSVRVPSYVPASCGDCRGGTGHEHAVWRRQPGRGPHPSRAWSAPPCSPCRCTSSDRSTSVRWPVPSAASGWRPGLRARPSPGRRPGVPAVFPQRTAQLPKPRLYRLWRRRPHRPGHRGDRQRGPEDGFLLRGLRRPGLRRLPVGRLLQGVFSNGRVFMATEMIPRSFRGTLTNWGTYIWSAPPSAS